MWNAAWYFKSWLNHFPDQQLNYLVAVPTMSKSLTLYIVASYWYSHLAYYSSAHTNKYQFSSDKMSVVKRHTTFTVSPQLPEFVHSLFSSIIYMLWQRFMVKTTKRYCACSTYAGTIPVNTSKDFVYKHLKKLAVFSPKQLCYTHWLMSSLDSYILSTCWNKKRMMYKKLSSLLFLNIYVIFYIWINIILIIFCLNLSVY